MDENEEDAQEKKLLKSFYTVYHIDKLHKKDSQKIVSLEELANSEYVQASVQEAPKRGLNPRRYSAQKPGIALSPKTLMALERWRNAQGPVFLPDKSNNKTIQKQFRNDRGGSGDDSGEEDIGSGLDVWNRHMAHIEHAKIVRRSQPTRQNSCNQEKDNFLKSKHAKKRAERLSFESVQSMPDISATTTNTNCKGPIITEVFSADEKRKRMKLKLRIS
uniref:Uncharacterized protein n=1 Tax=Ditylenchus dipsaci TaxID=166011 RepID=A0A915E6R9_9BILA